LLALRAGTITLVTLGAGTLASGARAATVATEAEAVTAFGGPAAFGRLIGMGTGPQAAMDRAAVITLEEIQAAEVTLPVARYWLDFYQNAVANGTGGASAPPEFSCMSESFRC